MPRNPRIIVKAVSRNEIRRENSRQTCFIGVADHRRYFNGLQGAPGTNNCVFHAHGLMANFANLLVAHFSNFRFSRAIQDPDCKCVTCINHSFTLSGTLCEGRSAACFNDTDACVLPNIRDIKLNPVRDNIAAHTKDFPWFGYTAYAENRINPVMYLDLHCNRTKNRLGQDCENV